jgi:hypothetical protein
MSQIEDFFSTSGVYLWCALAALVVLIGLWVLGVQLQLNRLMASHNRLVGGVDEGNLEDSLGRQISYILETKAKVDTLQGDLGRITETLHSSVQRVGLVRFNPFEDTGGDQSFAVALLDARGDGVVLSSLFARRETRVFAKPVQGGKSKHTLTAEELKAIELANTPRELPVVETARSREAQAAGEESESASS